MNISRGFVESFGPIVASGQNKGSEPEPGCCVFDTKILREKEERERNLSSKEMHALKIKVLLFPPFILNETERISEEENKVPGDPTMTLK